MKISDVINLAIEEYLWDGEASASEIEKEHASGYAGFRAQHEMRASLEFVNKIYAFLVELGWSEKVNFRTFTKGPKRQYARAFALTWAALMAEEEGV